MVKNVLIGKKAACEPAGAADAARFVGSRFILNERRAVMVNGRFAGTRRRP
jgi:hypothetical protein